MTVHLMYAFTEEGKGGNGAGVCVCPEMPDSAQMQEIAAEVNLSETAFLCIDRRSDTDVDYRIRFFTPVCEIDLCGHATIATFGYLYRTGAIAPGDHRVKTEELELAVRVNESGGVMMQQGAYEFESVPNASMPLIADSLGISTEDFDSRVPIGIASTGVRDLLIGVRASEVLKNLVPDFQAIRRISKELRICGYHVFVLADPGDSNGVAALCRNFAPLYGIDEESATGTSNAALAGRLVELQIWRPDRDYLIRQGMWMGAPSRIRVRVSDDIWVGGDTICSGEMGK